MSAAATRAWAVVANADNVMALSLVRSLGRHGVPVLALSGAADGFRPYREMVRASRHVRASRDCGPGPYEDALVEALLCIGERAAEKPVLFPVSDRDMLAVSRRRAELEPRFRLLLPPHRTVETLLCKERFARLAEAHGLPVPRTVAVESPDDAEACPEIMRFPCIVKPSWRDYAWFAAYGHVKLLRAASASQLRELLPQALRVSPRLVVQELIEGPDAHISCAFAFLDEASRPLGLVTCRKLRQYPAGFGNTSLAETVVDPELAELTRSVAAAIGAVGYLSLEVKRDPADGRPKILEITPVRLNRQAGIADVVGVNLPMIWYRKLTGGAPEPRALEAPGVRWVSELNELRALPGYLRDGSWSLGSWLRSYRGVRRCELLARDDLRPALAVPLAAARHAARRLVARRLGSRA